jgi:hypothetical protein
MARHRKLVVGDHVVTPAGSPGRVVAADVHRPNGNLSRVIVAVNGHRMFIEPERLTLIDQDLSAHYVPALDPFWKG